MKLLRTFILALAMLPLYTALHLCGQWRAADRLIDWWKACILKQPDALLRQIVNEMLMNGKAAVLVKAWLE